MKKEFYILAMLAALVTANIAQAAEKNELVLTLKDHQFSPKEPTIAAGQKVKLIIKNMDPTPAEFESHDLNREKIIKGNGEGVVFVGPLEPGRYTFFDEFNEATTKGTLIVK
jgi:hypothetical protein